MDANEWDDRYRQAREGQDARLWSALPAQLVQDTVTPWRAGRALDLATGDGRNAIWLAGRGWNVTGLDFSAEAIAQAGEHARAAGVDVTWLVADATTWQPEERFDLVTVMYLHLPEALFRTLLARALGWLAPGGHLLVLGHDRANIGAGGPGPGNPDILYTPELLASIVGPERVLRCETVSRDLATDPESPADTGGVALDTILVATA
ncbi:MULTISPECIES: bifunctional 2-polyprenyl-6-hydroxyphenol methylase/3-demethylubiquinol 3-O-methyltransferase UbiG [Cryobacterium]|uniref:class I SAM-dependent methyltransferase n=1 Tax=Cryobacterium TaxID=69578 RepID=UPI00106A165A|nr:MULTISPECIES: class I SAM-dependent methyltransferase [Cryobacterium]TFB91389.1 class I SAM-dependent methyltransferase [Cryobacterium sp. HLT2-28]